MTQGRNKSNNFLESGDGLIPIKTNKQNQTTTTKQPPQPPKKKNNQQPWKQGYSTQRKKVFWETEDWKMEIPVFSHEKP